jgi:glycosyltransferase involved in cell wall biosynthesis
LTTTAISHGYPPLWNMGGEVSLHRTLVAAQGDKACLTATDKPYVFEGVKVEKIDTPDVLQIMSNPRPIAQQLIQLDTKVAIGQNELSLATVKAAHIANAVSVISVHTPPRYGAGIREALKLSDYAVYNTYTSATQWGEPNALVVHPPTTPVPKGISTSGDAYTLLSSLGNKGVTVALELAKKYPSKRFIIVRSPAEATHGIRNLEELASQLPNVELCPRVAPEEVYKYLKQTRILLVPSRYETYGMSAIEAASYGIPSVHVDTPHVREGIGDGAVLVPGLNTGATADGIDLIERKYDLYSLNARKRAEWLEVRQALELEAFSDFIANAKKPADNNIRRRAVEKALRFT